MVSAPKGWLGSWVRVTAQWLPWTEVPQMTGYSSFVSVLFQIPDIQTHSESFLFQEFQPRQRTSSCVPLLLKAS